MPPASGAMGRIVFALAAQPFIAALLGFALFPVVEYTGRAFVYGRTTDLFDASLAFGLATGFAALFVTVFLAAPALAVLLKRGPITIKQTLVAGALLGNAPGLVITALILINGPGGDQPRGAVAYGVAGAIRAIAIGALIGGASAWVFWLMTRQTIGRGALMLAELEGRKR